MNVRLPEVWPDTNYVRFIKTVTGGVRAQTHLAIVRDANWGQRRAYVKHFPSDAPRSIFNEWFGHAFMGAVGVPQPASALMRVPVPGGSGALKWAFVSCEPPRFEGTPKQIYNIVDASQHQQLVERLHACTHFPLLVAADQAAMNGDRNLGNLVFIGKDLFVAIDHSDILGGKDWKSESLRGRTPWARSKLIEDLTPLSKLPTRIQGAIIASSEAMSELFFRCTWI